LWRPQTSADSYEPLNLEGDDGICTESDGSASDWSSEASASTDDLDFDSSDEEDDAEAHGSMLLWRADMEAFVRKKKVVNAMRNDGWHIGTLGDSMLLSYACLLFAEEEEGGVKYPKLADINDSGPSCEVLELADSNLVVALLRLV